MQQDYTADFYIENNNIIEYALKSPRNYMLFSKSLEKAVAY